MGLATASLAVLAACQTTAGPDEAVRFFNDVAFRGSPGGHPMAGSAMLELHFADQPLTRWETPIVAEIKGHPPEEYREQVEKLFADFNRLTGAAYSWHQDGGDAANFVVDFVPDEGYLINRIEYVPCFARSAIENGHLSRVEIKISLKKPDLVPHCIPHEMAHGFGLAHSNLLPSVISPKDRLRDFSRWDEVALKTLYDKRLRSGMPRSEALPIARSIILELLGTKT